MFWRYTAPNGKKGKGFGAETSPLCLLQVVLTSKEVTTSLPSTGQVVASTALVVAADVALGRVVGARGVASVKGAKTGVVPVVGLGRGPHVGDPPDGVAGHVPIPVEVRTSVVETVLGLVVAIGREGLGQVLGQLEGVTVPAGEVLVEVLVTATDVVPTAEAEVAVVLQGQSQGAAKTKDVGVDPSPGLVTWYVLIRATLAAPVDAEGVLVVPTVRRHDVRLAVDQVGLGHQA